MEMFVEATPDRKKIICTNRKRIRPEVVRVAWRRAGPSCAPSCPHGYCVMTIGTWWAKKLDMVEYGNEDRYARLFVCEGTGRAKLCVSYAGGYQVCPMGGKNGRGRASYFKIRFPLSAESRKIIFPMQVGDEPVEYSMLPSRPLTLLKGVLVWKPSDYKMG